MIKETEIIESRARLYSDLTKKLSETRRERDDYERKNRILLDTILFLVKKLDVAVLLTDAEMEQVTRTHKLKIYRNYSDELVIKAEKKHLQANADAPEAQKPLKERERGKCTYE